MKRRDRVKVSVLVLAVALTFVLEAVGSVGAAALVMNKLLGGRESP